MAADEAPGHPHSSAKGQRRGGGQDEVEAASRGTARPKRPDTRRDPVRFKLLGKAPQVQAVIRLTWPSTVAATFPASFLGHFSLFCLMRCQHVSPFHQNLLF